MTEQEILDALAEINVTTLTEADETEIMRLKGLLMDIRYPKPVPRVLTQEELDKQARITTLSIKLKTEDLTLSELNELYRERGI